MVTRTVDEIVNNPVDSFRDDLDGEASDSRRSPPMTQTQTRRRAVTRRTSIAAVGAAAALVLAACGSSSDDSGSTESATDTGSAGEMTTVTLGVIPILDVAPVYLGIDKGFFADEGLDIKTELAQGGAAIVPGVVSGQYQFGFSNTVSLLLATDKGLPVKVVASGNQAATDPAQDFGGVLVKADSGITSAKDLEGKKVAVNTLNNINTVTVSQMVRDDGGDPSTIEYVELAFPDIVPAVDTGDVDAGQVVEPFLTVGTDQGLTNIGSNMAGVEPDMQVAMYFTSTDYLDQNPDTVAAFTAAMNKSLTYAQENPDEARAILLEYTKIDEPTTEKVNLPQWNEQINTASVEMLAELGVQDGLFTEPDLATLLP
jgi:NitT/TauT family transport system substrate-binding protein